jgi:phospholipid/cholesterol/gamma-HCH transport system permease protein
MGTYQAIPRAIEPFFAWFGELGLFCARLTKAILAPPFEGRELLRQLDAIGAMSLPLVALAGAATGVVLSLERVAIA